MSATEEKIQKWTFFCKEVAKANDTLDLIEDLWSHIEIHDNAYNPVFSLVIDALTTKIFLHVGHLFDNQDDALRLSRIVTDKVHQKKLEGLKKEAEPFIEARNKEHAHLSKYAEEINYGSNFRLMNKHNTDKIRDILNEVSKVLRVWGVKYNNGGVIADRWGNISWSRELLFEAIEEYDCIRLDMTTSEHLALREKMKENHKTDGEA